MICEICGKEVQFPCMHHTQKEIDAAKERKDKPKAPEKTEDKTAPGAV